MKMKLIRMGLLIFLLWGVIFSPHFLRAQTAGSAVRGKLYYDGHCASCHGLSGDGNGPAGASMTPPPTNFKNSAVMSALADNDIQRAILVGKENTAMRGFGTVLQPQDVQDLVAYVRSFSP